MGHVHVLNWILVVNHQSLSHVCEKKKEKEKPSISQSHFVWMSSTRCVTLPENTKEGQTARHDSNIHDVVFRRRSFCRPKVERSHSHRQTENINIIVFSFLFSTKNTVTAKRTKSHFPGPVHQSQQTSFSLSNSELLKVHSSVCRKTVAPFACSARSDCTVTSAPM